MIKMCSRVVVVVIVSLWLTAIVVHACPYLDGQEQRGKRRRHLQGEQAAAPATFAATVPKSHIFDYHTTAQNLIRNPSCFAAAFLFKYPTCLSGAIQVATELINELITNNEGMAAKFVRLSFHDCVGGVCDGCVDLANPSNFGLAIPIDALTPVVEHTKQYLTTADVWALAGSVACRVSQDETTFKFPLQFIGRTQCSGNATKAGPHRDLPSAHFTTKQVLNFFDKNFKFTPQESVAILGAHTLGKATSENSGFGGEGGWDTNSNVLNNEYYKELLDFGQFGLDFEENTDFPPFPDQFYWEEEVEEGAPDGTFMLHADMALAFNMRGHINPTTGDVNCTLVRQPGEKLCPSSFLLPQAEAYALNNALWVRDFQAVFLKMVNTGCGNGVCQAI